jgi:hypothetical protein
MALTLATVENSGTVTLYKDGTGANDNDVIVQTNDVTSFNTFHLMSTAGALDVFPSLDGTNYATAALSLTDLGATVSDPVIVTVANRVYRFRGAFRKIQVMQNGATAGQNVVLMCSKS